MLDLIYTIDRGTIRFAAVSPKGWGKCDEMAQYQNSTGPFLSSQLESIVTQLESEGYTIAVADSVGAKDPTPRSDANQPYEKLKVAR
jgi:hypothetical protein